METESEVFFTCRDGAMEICRRSGDLEKERQMHRRMVELGLWTDKEHHETQLRHTLADRIVDMDDLSRVLGAVSSRRTRRRRRSRPASEPEAQSIRDRLERTIIRRDRVEDGFGRVVAQRIDVLLGRFTRDVSYGVIGGTVTVHCTGICEGVQLDKEISITFQSDTHDTSTIRATLSAGTVRIMAPLRNIQGL